MTKLNFAFSNVYLKILKAKNSLVCKKLLGLKKVLKKLIAINWKRTKELVQASTVFPFLPYDLTFSELLFVSSYFMQECILDNSFRVLSEKLRSIIQNLMSYEKLLKHSQV